MYTRPRQVAKTREKKKSKDIEHDGRLSKCGVKTEKTLTKHASDKRLVCRIHRGLRQFNTERKIIF